MDHSESAEKVLKIVGSSILGGIAGGGLAMFGWVWTFMGGYQLFFAQGNWGGAAFQYEQPVLCFWTALGTGLMGALAGIIGANLYISARSFSQPEEAKKREETAAAIFAISALPLLPIMIAIALALLGLTGIVQLGIFSYKRAMKKQRR